MAENVSLVKIDTNEAISNINELREAISTLKEQVNQATIGTTDYQEKLGRLKTYQAALKDAMYATNQSFEQLEKAANGTGETYNSLVNQMAQMKRELRSIDVSTAEGRDSFNKLAKEINDTNDKLKEMDALQGNYTRNVGNYGSALGKLTKVVNDLPDSLGGVKSALTGVGNTMNLIGKQPLMGIIGLLAPLITKIADSLKENKSALNSVNNAMASLQPIMDLMNTVVETLAGWISKAVDYFVQLAGKSGETFKKIMAGAIGVGNVVKEAVLGPVMAVIEGVKGLGKIIKDLWNRDFDQLKQDASDTWDSMKNTFASAFAFEDNFNVGVQVGEAFVAGLKSSAKKAQLPKALQDFLKEAEKEINNMKFDETLGPEWTLGDKGLEKEMQMRLAAMEKVYKNRLEWNKLTENADKTEKENERARAAEAYRIQEEYDQKRLALLRKFADEAMKAGNIEESLAYEQQAADLSIQIEQRKTAELMRLRKLNEQDTIERNKNIMTITQKAANLTGQILGTIAAFYQSNEEETKKNAKKIKALQIAQATINTLAGALGAFMGITRDTGGWGIAAAVLAATTTLAAGVAEINKIRNTDLSGGGSTPSATSALGAVSAPSVNFAMPEVRNITSASDEERLNQMASDQRVYIVASDIAESQDHIRTQVSESSF